MAALMLIVFLALLAIGAPLFVAMLAGALSGILCLGDLSLLKVMAQQFFGGMDVFSLMAIPLYILAGILMNKAEVTDRLLELSEALVGRVRGGLGYVNVVASMLFAGVNGSAAADSSALGVILIPTTVKQGYPPSYAAGITAGSSLIGPIIPPSIFMILYASMTGTSVGGLFLAGVVPGVLLGFAFLLMNYYYSRKYDFPYSAKSYTWGEKLQVVRRSLIALIGPFIILGGIATGIVTPTESGALAVAYVALAGIFITKRLTWARIAEAVFETVRLTSSILVMIGAAAVVGWLLKWQQAPQESAALVMGFTHSPVAIMLILTGLTFVLGMFMEEIATLALLTPIFTPIAMAAGIDPLHFGIVMSLNVTIALITPPMGACLFVVSAVGKVRLDEVFRTIWPFAAVALATVLLVIVFPALATAVPRMLGL